SRGGRRCDLRRVVRQRWSNDLTLRQRRQDAELLVLIDLAEASANQRLAVASRVVRDADARPERVLRFRNGPLPVVADAEVQRQPLGELPFVLHVRTEPMIDLAER